MNIEQRAIEFVISFERKQGRNPKVLELGSGYDILSSGRKIEVKGHAPANPPFVIFSEYNHNALQKALKQKESFYLYIVYNLRNKNPRLIILDKLVISKRAKPPKLSWRIPIWENDRNNSVEL